MKLIINISDKDYESIKGGYVPHSFNMLYAIRNGIPLDKIKAEIEQAKMVEIKPDNGNSFSVSSDYVVNPQYRNCTSGLDIALQIIDKYR